MQLYGNTGGLPPSTLQSLEKLYRRRVPFDRLTTPELSKSLCDASRSTHRQVGVLINREGGVDFVIVGDASKLLLPDLGRLRAGAGRLRGLRLIHTHLRQEPLTHDDLVDLTRLRLDLVAAICMHPDGAPGSVYFAHNVPSPDGAAAPYRLHGPIPHSHLDTNPASIIGALEEEYARVARSRPVVARDGRALLIHVCDKAHANEADESLDELRELARTAGVEVADTILQVRDRVDPKYMLGRGKLEDVVIRAMQLDVEVLIFDRDLSAAQVAAIAGFTDLKILDRSQLILDIFAQRAHSRDGKMQVELAQMKYLLPRLGVRDDALSRLTGGIGGRGPGETKLEIGRRRARERVTRIQAELKQFSKQRQQRRARRSKRGVPIIAIVGYTNAGKSTLLNSLTEDDALAEDKLFATLDTRSRRLRLPREREVVITDTVGFIRRLPKDLFAAFRSTFEEASDADLLLHLVDASHPAADEHISTTERLLVELDLQHIPRLLVYNKVDRIDADRAAALANSGQALAIVAKDLRSLQPLLDQLDQLLFAPADASADQE